MAISAGAYSRLVGYLYLRSWPTRRLPYYDHLYNHLLGPSAWFWTERGVFGTSVIKEGGKVLDVCCGDGSYAGLFYSTRAGRVDGIDRDSRAIHVANRRYRRSNTRFFEQDVLDAPFPDPPYDVIFLFAAIEHFTEEDGARLLRKILSSLKPGGVFMGSTPIFAEAGGHNHEHANEFLSEQSLRAFLSQHLRDLRIWTSPWPGRIEAYFQASRPDHDSADVAARPQEVVNRLSDRDSRIGSQQHRSPGL